MTDNLGSHLANACRRFSDSPAIDGGDSGMSYAEILRNATAVAQELESRRLTTNEPILVVVRNQPQDLATFIGVWLAGGVAAPVSANAPRAVIEQIRATTGARVCLSGKAIDHLSSGPPESRELLNNAALIIFTSGSTGRPKGVVLSHNAFLGKLHAIDEMLHFTTQTRALLVLQITFVFGLWVSLLTLMKGGRLLMHAQFEPLAVLDALGQWGITDVAFVPTMLRRILSLDRAISGPVLAQIGRCRILAGGEPFDRGLHGQLRTLLPGAEVTDIYGLTETCSSDFFCTIDSGGHRAGAIGRPSPRVEFRIADEQGGNVPENSAGDLQIRTPFIMNGYLDDPPLTQAAFANGFFRTGDLALTRRDGLIELVGRTKELINRGGAKVSPLELDRMFAQHPAVAAALTVGIPDQVIGERIHVMIVPRDQAITEMELRHWIAQRVEKFKRPDVYHFAAELPVGRTGKGDRNALRERLCTGGPHEWNQRLDRASNQQRG